VAQISEGRLRPATPHGAEESYVFDAFTPERIAKHTFRFFGIHDLPWAAASPPDPPLDPER
jgi:hypothetical protein